MDVPPLNSARPERREGGNAVTVQQVEECRPEQNWRLVIEAAPVCAPMSFDAVLWQVVSMEEVVPRTIQAAVDLYWPGRPTWRRRAAGTSGDG